MAQLHAYYKYGGTETIKVTATAAHNPGDIVVYGGFVGFVHGCQAIASGDIFSMTIDGIIEAATATGTTFAAGAVVYWNTSTKLCVAAAGANIVALGTAVIAKASGVLVTVVALNRVPLDTAIVDT